MIEIAHQIITSLKQGEVIAYPTEAVYGLGCDPDNQAAVAKILAIKQRPMAKGLILIAASYQQLSSYINDSSLTEQQQQNIANHWPGPYTYVFPAQSNIPKWLTGDFDTIAVRVSSHPVVQALCLAYGKPIVSTSANLSGQPAIIDKQQLATELGPLVSHIVPGEVNPNLQPSTIIDAASGRIYRS